MITATGQGNCAGQASTSVYVNWPPGVSLTSPLHGNTYVGPASIGLSAAAWDPDGAIAHVRFYVNGVLLDTDVAAPYEFAWSNVPAGTYTFSAVATDNAGVARGSNAAVVTVNNPGPSVVTSVVVSPAVIAPGQAAAVIAYGTNPCGLVHISFGDGNGQHFPIVQLPFGVSYAWPSPGTYTVTATGHGNCSGQVSTTVTVR